MLPSIGPLPTVDTGPFRFKKGEAGSGYGTARSWRPLGGPQTDAYTAPVFELLYGGAAGGGKTDLLLGLARYKHKRSLLLRRTFPDAERSLITRSLEFYGDQRQYNASKHVWRIGGNRRVEIGHLEYDKDVYQYQGAAYDLIGFDELTQFTKNQYEYLISRARTTDKRQPVQVVSCSNPGGEGNDWVMERWAAWIDESYPNPAKPGEVRYFKRGDDGREVETTIDDPDALSRTFIPAKLADNPFLGEDYRRALKLMPEPLRSQLLAGDWKAGLVDDAYQVIPRAWVKAAQARWGARPPVPLTRLGVDVARGGDDQTTLAPLYGAWFGEIEKHPGRTTPDGKSVVALIVPWLTENPDAHANIDVIGVGASVYDTARGQGLPVYGVNFAEHTDLRDKSGKLRFINVRAAAYWSLRDALDPSNGLNVALPPDQELLGDLIAPRWSMQTNGVKIESKEDIKKRIGRSPDCGDAVVLAWWNDMQEITVVQDPFSDW